MHSCAQGRRDRFSKSKSSPRTHRTLVPIEIKPSTPSSFRPHRALDSSKSSPRAHRALNPIEVDRRSIINRNRGWGGTCRNASVRFERDLDEVFTMRHASLTSSCINWGWTTAFLNGVRCRSTFIHFFDSVSEPVWLGCDPVPIELYKGGRYVRRFVGM